MRNSLLVIVLALLVMVGHLSLSGWHLKMPDAMYYASLARRLLETGQYQGPALIDSELATIDRMIEHDRLWPVDYARPGAPLLIAGLFALFGVSDITYQLTNILAFCALAWAVYRISVVIHDNSPRAGLLSVGLLVAIPAVLTKGAKIGLEMPFVAAILVAAALLVGGKRWLSAAGAGAVLAGAMFMRPTALAFLPLGLLIMANRTSDRRRQMVAFVIAFVLLVGLGYAIQARLNPAPLNPDQPFNYTAHLLLWQSEAPPGALSEPATWGRVAAHWQDVAEKFARKLNVSGGRLIFATPYWLIALVVWAVAKRGKKSRILPVAAVAAASGLLIMGGINLTTPEALARHILPAGAMLAAVAGGGLEHLLAASRRRLSHWQHWCVVSILIVTICYSRAFMWAEQAKIPNASLQAEAEKVGVHIRQYTWPGDIVVASSCAVPLIMWRGECRAAHAPRSGPELRKVVEELLPADAVLLCQTHQPDVCGEADKLLADFKLVDRFDYQSSVYHCDYRLYVRNRDQAGRPAETQ